MAKYEHIFFDLDHTLWDFERNSSEVLCDLYFEYSFDVNGLFSLNDFLTTFQRINYTLWDKYNKKLIDKCELRETRFNIVLKKLGMKDEEIPLEIGERYLELCPQKPHVMPFAFDILNYLKDKYKLHIITNGFEDVQFIKLQSARLFDYFDIIMTSDRAGCQKPDAKIFNEALSSTSASPDSSVMIGDNPDTDIAGAISAKIDAVHYNPSALNSPHRATYEIACLSELRSIL
ncbi:MAG TPA: noncanonical pyrimidine nucleotidase, YjjG family [Cytophagales bacterium]|jgi:putative hydrolase of the HAD superfamily|nr:noncanonical pyrimidine nucleotidase, YjjG family [Cytophagales bacterium]